MCPSVVNTNSIKSTSNTDYITTVLLLLLLVYSLFCELIPVGRVLKVVDCISWFFYRPHALPLAETTAPKHQTGYGHIKTSNWTDVAEGGSYLAVCGDGCGEVRRSGTGGKRFDAAAVFVEVFDVDDSLNGTCP